MKKTFFKVAGLLTVASSLFLASCGDSEEQIINTANEVSAPNIDVKAYPGVNIITLKDVKNANNYYIYKTEGNGTEKLLATKIAKNNNSLVIEDFDNLLENTRYTYRVIAKGQNTQSWSDSEASKSVTTAKAEKTAAYGTSFLNLAQYESNYNAKEEVISADTIKVAAKNNNADLLVTFPVKPYASYQIKYGPKGSVEAAASTTYSSLTKYGYEFDKKAVVQLNNMAAGEIEVAVVATPLYNGYIADTVVAASTVTIDQAEVSAENVAAAWLDSSKVRVSFTADAANGTDVEGTVFTVYRQTAYASAAEVTAETWATKDTWTKLGAATKATSAKDGSTVYYFDDTTVSVTDKKVTGYTYTVVANYNGKINGLAVGDRPSVKVEDAAGAAIKLDPSSDITLNFTTKASVNASDEVTGNVDLALTATHGSSVKLYVAEFTTLNAAKNATAEQVTTEVNMTFVEGLPNVSKTEVDGKPTVVYGDDDYSVNAYTLKAGKTVDYVETTTGANTTTTKNTGSFYVFKAVATKEGSETVVAGKVVYQTKNTSTVAGTPSPATYEVTTTDTLNF